MGKKKIHRRGLRMPEFAVQPVALSPQDRGRIKGAFYPARPPEHEMCWLNTARDAERAVRRILKGLGLADQEGDRWDNLRRHLPKPVSRSPTTPPGTHLF